jgi:hypothetical protein
VRLFFIFSKSFAFRLLNYTVAGRTLLHTILSSLERIAFNDDPLQLMVMQTSYQPFISLFHQTDMVKEHPELKAIRAPRFSFLPPLF